jgi:predicted hydrocarbon binding protein
LRGSNLSKLPPGKRAGVRQFGMTDLETERFKILLEQRTYKEAADRAGCTLEAMKKTVGRVKRRYKDAKSLTNFFEDWKRQRREFKQIKKTIRKPLNQVDSDVKEDAPNE